MSSRDGAEMTSQSVRLYRELLRQARLLPRYEALHFHMNCDIPGILE